MSRLVISNPLKIELHLVHSHFQTALDRGSRFKSGKVASGALGMGSAQQSPSNNYALMMYGLRKHINKSNSAERRSRAFSQVLLFNRLLITASYHSQK